MRNAGLENILIDTTVSLKEVTEPTYVRANTLKLYAKDNSGVSHLYYMDDALVEHDLIDAVSVVHTLLDATDHSDTVAQTVSRGSLVYGNSTPKWDELTIGANTRILGSDGTDVAWKAQSFIDHGSISGLADDDHTQYVLRSILTTNGDLFVRLSGAVSRLGIGSDGYVLTIDNSTHLPVWSAPSGGASPELVLMLMGA